MRPSKARTSRCSSIRASAAAPARALFVEEKAYDEFVERSAARAKKRTVGDPFDPKTEQGPQVDRHSVRQSDVATSNPARRRARSWWPAAIASGDRGYFVEPTVFCRCAGQHEDRARKRSSDRCMSIIKFKDLDEVVERANKTMYGLAAGGLDARHRQGARHRQQRPRGHGLGQLLRRVRRRGAVRRLQAVRHRAGTGRIRPAAVYGSKDRHREALSTVPVGPNSLPGRQCRRPFLLYLPRRSRQPAR